LTIAVPFNMAVPAGKNISLYTYDDNGYAVTVFPPITLTDQPHAGTKPDALIVNDGPGFFANGLVIQFFKATFDRTIGASVDPPLELVQKAINSFLTRLRYVTRGQMISLVGEHFAPWRIRYLNDDGSELPQQEGYVRGRFEKRLTVSYVAIDESVWHSIFTLPSDFVSPVWDTLRLDALAALPSIGTAIVLASASLEVFIDQTLDALAEKSTVPAELWRWINEREHFLKDPNPHEQFDVLLKVLTGHSLKEDLPLWQSFTNLKNARNTFVHSGVATIGGKEVTESQAAEMVVRVNDIISRIRGWLPDVSRWPEFVHPVTTSTVTSVFQPSKNQS